MTDISEDNPWGFNQYTARTIEYLGKSAPQPLLEDIQECVEAAILWLDSQADR